MNQRFTYSNPTRTLSFPATASHICVSEPRPTSLSHPVQPLKGLRDPRAASVSYRALAPVGAGTGHRVCAGTSDPRPTANYSLLTANRNSCVPSARCFHTASATPHYAPFGRLCGVIRMTCLRHDGLSFACLGGEVPPPNNDLLQGGGSARLTTLSCEMGVPLAHCVRGGMTRAAG